jgi:hypothetical protein
MGLRRISLYLVSDSQTGFSWQEHGAAALKENLDLYASWEREVEKMRARQPCGILEVESRKLR